MSTFLTVPGDTRAMELVAAVGPVTVESAASAETVDDFDDAYPALFRRAYRVGYRILGSRAEAEEVAQESLAAALLRWKRIHDYREAWVARVASNKAISVVRRRRRAEDPGQMVDLVHDGDTALRLDLQRALLSLPKRQREVVALRYLADQTEAETARALGCSIGTVKQHAFRALRTLRQTFDGLPEEL